MTATAQPAKQFKLWGQRVEETPSGKTWKVFIRNAFWDKTVGINARIVNEACKKFERRIEISCLNPLVTFIIPAWKIRLEGKPYYRKSKFPGGPDMKFWMIPIPREKLEALGV